MTQMVGELFILPREGLSSLSKAESVQCSEYSVWGLLCLLSDLPPPSAPPLVP